MQASQDIDILRIQVVSDLHLDKHEMEETELTFPWTNPDADLVVVAGDVSNGPEGIARLRTLFPDTPIVMVAGNHEWYGMWWHNGVDVLRAEAKKHDIVLLENETWEFKGVRFMGATLWTDYEYYGAENRGYLIETVPKLIKDFLRIGVADEIFGRVNLPETYEGHQLTGDLLRQDVRPLRPHDVIERHYESRFWLTDRMQEPQDMPTVVISHHLPHELSMNTKYASSATNGAFISRLDEVFDLPGAPDFWLHGHTHSSANYKVGRTQVVCNPMGYPRAEPENPEFNPRMLIEIPLRHAPDVNAGRLAAMAP